MEKKLFKGIELKPIVDNHASYYGKAIIVEKDGIKALYSYNTLVASYDESTGEFTIIQNPKFWSVTSRRHITEFYNQMQKSHLKPREVYEIATLC